MQQQFNCLFVFILCWIVSNGCQGWTSWLLGIDQLTTEKSAVDVQERLDDRHERVTGSLQKVPWDFLGGASSGLGFGLLNQFKKISVLISVIQTIIFRSFHICDLLTKSISIQSVVHATDEQQLVTSVSLIAWLVVSRTYHVMFFDYMCITFGKKKKCFEPHLIH